MRRVVILGGGTGGAVAARRFGLWAEKDEVEVVLIDRSPWHEYRPSYLWVMTGNRRPEQVRRPLQALERYGTHVVQASVESIDPENHQLETSEGAFEFDNLIVALGAELVGDQQLAGLEAPWELDHAVAMRRRLADFAGGEVVVGPVAWPYRCPPAPFEVAFMMRYLADQRHLLDTTRVTVFHPWERPMETFGPVMVDGFGKFLDDFDVGFEGKFDLVGHDADNKILRSGDGRDLSYDLAVVIPRHRPPRVIAESPLAAPGEGYMDVSLPSMSHPEYPDIFGVGDVVAPTIGLGMAGVFAHFQADHVVTQILDQERGAFMGELYNMIGICVMDTGYMGAAVWCDFTDKLYGRAEYPDCRMLGGMRAFRSVKAAFEKFWFASLFGA